MFLFIALMLVLVSVFQNSYVEVHGGGKGGSQLSVGATGQLAERLYREGENKLKDKVNKTLIEKYGRR
ncbi:unnamed protein product [Schistosoma rodhaini]|uniref:Uncharacterized protein n=1 Tax=Schistosoma rodhaini TaxID=6188 RepID=A0AA85GI17_9TREM|nr:unnamed protein product [Schistosoma rodhaini]